MNPPKKIFCILILVFSFFLSYSQDVTINGIQIKVPNGFVYQEENKSVDFWINKDDKKSLVISFLKRDKSHSSYESRKAIKRDTETTEYMDFVTLEILGKKYDIQTNINFDNLTMVAQTMVYRGGYLYVITYVKGFDENFLDENYAKKFTLKLYEETIYFIKMILTS